MKNKIIIWGAGAQARVAADIIRLQNEFEIAGFIDDFFPERQGESFCDSVVLGSLEAVRQAAESGVRHVFLAFGDDDRRLELAKSDMLDGFEFPSIIHPSAVIANESTIESGTLIKAGVTMDAGTEVGNFCFIGSQAAIGHGSVIEDGVILGSCVTTGANTRLGYAARLSPGVVVSKGVSIGARSVIGTGAIVMKSIPDGVLAYGSPAKIIRSIKV